MNPQKKVFISSENAPYSFNEEHDTKHPQETTIDYARFIQKKDGPYNEDYELIENEFLGAGGFGSVYKVKWKLNNEVRAMKIISKKSSQQNENFRKEFQILKQLDHPSILKLYHSFEDEDKFYIISELCEGGNLFDYILSQDSIHEKEICKIMYQLLSAVMLAHNNHIVHRDIKPENILLDDQITTSIKLIDWGLLGMLEDEKLEQKCGSLHYVAPEVLQGSYDEKCDIWSCGVVLYVLLCNDPPFSGKDTQEILSNIHKGNLDFKYKIWNKYSEEVKSLLADMLQKDPELRSSAKQCLLHPWFESRLSEQIASQEYKDSLIQFNAFTQENQQSLTQKRFIQAIILFIAVEIVHKKDKELLYRVFRKIDKDGDGTISKEELRAALEGFYGSEVEEKVDKIFEFLDINSSGSIDFSEFVAATCKLKDIEKQMRIAFDFFDENKDGQITLDEIAKVVGPSENWKELFQTFDSNSDQRLSFNEFQQALRSYVNMGKQLEK